MLREVAEAAPRPVLTARDGGRKHRRLLRRPVRWWQQQQLARPEEATLAAVRRSNPLEGRIDLLGPVMLATL